VFAIDRILYRQFAELALKHAEHRVGLYWPAIRNVAEKLRQAGHLTGEEVEDIVWSSQLVQREKS